MNKNSKKMDELGKMCVARDGGYDEERREIPNAKSHGMIMKWIFVKVIFRNQRNDAVGGASHNAFHTNAAKSIYAEYRSMGSSERKDKLAASRCTGLVSGLRLAALSRPDF
ncbi:hypothetical protein GUITHDRAFT_102809 [Guillardia theta CCMP2712]|uniref:Uncharacterized protein n=1 Tax=Guillardia theta (strain CCMP2712) TaxID=905079 RepID=L1JSX5_GUITC|nr:hypothetical protein GUITHDRAFT_102809 [Guillardia theta CCMP2712]EKX51547.1 hypothetical protein GUITHDRAFT_102809 [Guillardia theta CCMP2712]|eukprot:XP_005838527.1 hypothetical protein GUITHDRAFT_102809 [Guillardia theta CCMP2712]